MSTMNRCGAARIGAVFALVAGLGGAAACGGGEGGRGLVLTLTEIPAGTTQVEVVLLGPSETWRTQRDGVDDLGRIREERVVYLHQADLVDVIPVTGGATAMTVRLDDDEERRPVIPLVIARGANDEIVGAGVYDAPGLFDENDGPALSVRTPEAGYAVVPIALERAAPPPRASGGPFALRAGEAIEPRCEGARRGLAWRSEKEGKQLRALYAPPGQSTAKDLFELPDFDCDAASVGEGAVDPTAPGAGLDCDDLDGAVAPGAPESATCADAPARDLDCDEVILPFASTPDCEGCELIGGGDSAPGVCSRQEGTCIPNGTGFGCGTCIVPVRAQTPCSDFVKLPLGQCADPLGCEVFLLDSSPDIRIAPMPDPTMTIGIGGRLTYQPNITMSAYVQLEPAWSAPAPWLTLAVRLNVGTPRPRTYVLGSREVPCDGLDVFLDCLPQ